MAGQGTASLDDEEAVGLGGVELIRAAMRKTARQLGWKATCHQQHVKQRRCHHPYPPRTDAGWADHQG